MGCANSSIEIGDVETRPLATLLQAHEMLQDAPGLQLVHLASFSKLEELEDAVWPLPSLRAISHRFFAGDPYLTMNSDSCLSRVDGRLMSIRLCGEAKFVLHLQITAAPQEGNSANSNQISSVPVQEFDIMPYVQELLGFNGQLTSRTIFGLCLSTELTVVCLSNEPVLSTPVYLILNVRTNQVCRAFELNHLVHDCLVSVDQSRVICVSTHCLVYFSVHNKHDAGTLVNFRQIGLPQRIVLVRMHRSHGHSHILFKADQAIHILDMDNKRIIASSGYMRDALDIESCPWGEIIAVRRELEVTLLRQSGSDLVTLTRTLTLCPPSILNPNVPVLLGDLCFSTCGRLLGYARRRPNEITALFFKLEPTSILSLKHLCRKVLRFLLTNDQMNLLPVPVSLQEYLKRDFLQ